MVIGLIYKATLWLTVSNMRPAQAEALPRVGTLALGNVGARPLHSIAKK